MPNPNTIDSRQHRDPLRAVMIATGWLAGTALACVWIASVAIALFPSLLR